MDREPAQSFHDLVVWQKAHAFVLATYRFSANFPVHETYGLRAQLRRAAVSVPANISEGFKKRGKADKARVLNIAEASLEESRYYLLLAHDLGYGRDPALSGQAEGGSQAAYGLHPEHQGFCLVTSDSEFCLLNSVF